ncbi:glycosyl hydrolase [Skermania sp. ID1734]|uniref:MGDG synthase family glycosyltransferase n=1 Tax=Skermania sp. ID1734 TaxID=2597516 RepID=UPI00117D69DB|nr:glycosyltransferase [Skermania sp. ID1734]TSD99242.1 glycosyl hydrolase [Skermania sp. ID1734]
MPPNAVRHGPPEMIRERMPDNGFGRISADPAVREARTGVADPSSSAELHSALILSGDIGAGHKVVAATVADLLAPRGCRVHTLDSMALLGSAGASAGEAAFRRLLDIPGVYDAFHFSCLRPGTWPARFADRAARHYMVPRLAKVLEADRPDVVLAVFATGAAATAELARAGAAPPVVAFCTDVTPHRLWVHDGIGAYLVICKAAAEAVRRYQPRAHVVVVPRPVRRGFLTAPSQSVARRAFDVPAGEPCALLMSGGWGLGPISEAAAALADAGVHVLAVAGSNSALADRLRAVARSRPRIRPFGFTTEVPALMSAADLVITTSGVTCSEARAVGRPMLLLDVVPGHGRENLQQELELGGAAVASTDAASLTASALAVLERGTKIEAYDPTQAFTAGLDEVLASVRR